MHEKQSDSFLFVWMLVAIVFLSFLSLWQRTRMTGVGYEIQALKTHREKLIKLQKQLLIEMESVSALDKVEEAAISQLGMVPASPTTRIYMKGQDVKR